MSKKTTTKKNKSGQYFDEREEEAVIQYLNCDDIEEKHRIFKTYLEYPLYKLVEGIINRYQLYSKEMSFEELHHEILSFLIEKMDKYDPSLGFKAYSYYGTIVVRRLRHLQKEEKLRTNRHIQYDDSFGEDEKLSYQIDEDDNRDEELMIESFKQIKKEIEYILNVNEQQSILKSEERAVGIAILEIMNNWDNLNFEEERGFNKKYEKNKILMCLRNITGYSTKDIRKYSKRFKKLYYKCKNNILDEF